MARPRSEQAHEQVLQAAIQLFSERGIEGTSIDSIAALSGVSKATIYKHWADKDALCLDALTRAHDAVDAHKPLDPTRDVRAELIAMLNYRPPEEQRQMQARLRPFLMAYAAKNVAFGNEWRARVTDPARRNLRELLTRGIAEGRLSADLRIDTAEALLLGPMIYRHIFAMSLPLDQAELAESAVNAFWTAYGREEC